MTSSFIKVILGLDGRFVMQTGNRRSWFKALTLENTVWVWVLVLTFMKCVTFDKYICYLFLCSV